ncbi:MAG: methyltransferase domain-containing protein, partial [Anaerolineae bacterium]
MIQAKCWCGNTELVPFSPEYWRCPVCESLVTSRTPAQSATPRVLDDNHDFYGRDYWFSYQEKDLGFPNIMVRSRTDLPERCLYWLRTVLKYKLPPASVLELGSAHGGFVAMLRWAGFEATGLELSPWVVEFARQHFGVPMLLGAIEDQQVEPGSLDMIALMDVLEHLPDPVGTIQHCLNLLKPDGVMIIQTPCYPEGKSYEEMVAEGNRFLELLKADEHLYLFSRQSIREFFHRLGAEHLAFEPAIFAHYDMFLVVSRVPLAAYLPDGIAKALSATPNGRMIQALLDLDDQYRSLQSRYAELEADRAARLENLQRLERLLAEAERDRAARLGVIEAQGAEIARLQAEVHRWLEENKALWQQVGEMEAERNRLQAQLADLRQQFESVEADRAARLGVIEAQGAEIARLQAEVHR